jgi:hypothetical protein
VTGCLGGLDLTVCGLSRTLAHWSIVEFARGKSAKSCTYNSPTIASRRSQFECTARHAGDSNLARELPVEREFYARDGQRQAGSGTKLAVAQPCRVPGWTPASSARCATHRGRRQRFSSTRTGFITPAPPPTDNPAHAPDDLLTDLAAHSEIPRPVATVIYQPFSSLYQMRHGCYQYW